MRVSACIEWLFADEAAAIGDRIRLAHAAGFREVEFWHWSNKDLNEVERALGETGVKLTAILAEPKAQLTDPATHRDFLESLGDSIKAARQLGAGILIVQSGDRVAGAGDAEQRAALIDILSRAAPIAASAGVTLALEPLNTVLDRPDYFLSSTRDGLVIIDAVGHPSCKLLYDLYHSGMMGELVVDVLGRRMDAVAHVHLADIPGRGAPGTGRAPWSDWLRRLAEQGYSGAIGLEYRPQGRTADTIAEIMAFQADMSAKSSLPHEAARSG